MWPPEGELLENLSRTEHLRWCAFHSVMGYDYVPVITSGNDYPYHARNSKHYENKALDFRLKGLLPEERRSVIEMSQKRLEGRARVLWEKGEAEHLHVELLD